MTVEKKDDIQNRSKLIIKKKKEKDDDPEQKDYLWKEE